MRSPTSSYAMWIRLNLDLTTIFLPLATGASAAFYVLVALGGLVAAAWVRHPRRALRVAAWSGGLAAFCVALTASMALWVDLPWPDDDVVYALLWVWLVLFLSGIALIAWQGRGRA